ncbi:MAG: tyrosine-protein phosphatase [Beutenbergiaceae bacterium]
MPWIDVDGAANMRDVAGIRTSDGRTVQPGKLLRSDNLQDLTPADISLLRTLGLTDVIDLRRPAESGSTGPGPLNSQPWVRIHQLSLFRESEPQNTAQTMTQVLPPSALPWIEHGDELNAPATSPYLAYLASRPDSVVSALRVLAQAPGATMVHCAAGKDRTGTIVALALLLVGVEPAPIIEDYLATDERIEAVLARLRSTSTYQDVLSRPVADYRPSRELMADFIEQTAPGGDVSPLLDYLGKNGWTTTDTAQLRAKLIA